MKISVIICTIGRAPVLHETIQSILAQTYPAEQILISTPSRNNVLDETTAIPNVVVVQSRLGSSAQRNDALDFQENSDLIAFLDDDMELCNDYFENMVRLFEQNPNTVIASGHLLHDGGITTPIDREKAKLLCAQKIIQGGGREIQIEARRFGYGCNMFVNARLAGEYRFDERLPLYAWLEDSDYSARCTAARARPVTCLNSIGVHLGWRGGRVSGYRLGFSQIVNPLYLWKKGRVFTFPYIVTQYWLRCLAGNIIGTLTGNAEEDRLGRLAGNWCGIRHVLRGECDPGHVLKMVR